MQSANASRANIFDKIDDRKMYGLTGKVVEARYSDGTLMKFDKTGRLIRLNDKKFAYQDSCKYAGARYCYSSQVGMLGNYASRSLL